MNALRNLLRLRASAVTLLVAAFSPIDGAVFAATPASTFVDDPGVLHWTDSHADQGVAGGARVIGSPEGGTCTLPLRALKRVRSPNIPHGCPVFVPFWSEIGKPIPFDVTRAESILVSIDPGLDKPDYNRVHGVNLERVRLE